MSEAQEQTNPVEGVRPEVLAFKEAVAKADGTLLPLRKTTANGKRLYIATRYVRNPDLEEDTRANPEFYGWEKANMPKHPFTRILLVDTYVEDDSEIVPLGHMDWYLHNDYANGGSNLHEASIPKGEHEQLSRQWWHDSIAFKVEYAHHQQGLGSLMVATSAVTLPALGVRNFYTGGLLAPAKRTYARFSINEKDFPETVNPFDKHLPIEKLTQSPQVNKAISEFV